MDNLGIEDQVLDCLQWCNLLVAETELRGYTPKRQPNPSMESVMKVLEHVATLRKMPPKTIFLFHRILSFTSESQAVNDISRGWKSLDRLADIIDGHKLSCDRMKDQLAASLQSWNGRGQSKEAYALSQLFDMGKYSLVLRSAYEFTSQVSLSM